MFNIERIGNPSMRTGRITHPLTLDRPLPCSRMGQTVLLHLAKVLLLELVVLGFVFSRYAASISRWVAMGRFVPVQFPAAGVNPGAPRLFPDRWNAESTETQR